MVRAPAGDVARTPPRAHIIKERPDFSCAIFDPDGMLVANAPHIPIHLGSMSESVRTVIRENSERMKPGDVFVLETPSGVGYGPPAEFEGDSGEQ